MKRSFFVTILVTILPFNLISDEPSAFGAGDLSNPQPYGLTSSEEVLLENKKNLRKVVVKSNNQANEVDSLRDRIDGLQSIVESLNMKSQANKKNLALLDKQNNDELKSSDEYEKRLSTISQLNSESINTNLESIKKIKTIMAELSTLIDNINASYVTKDEFNSLVKDVNKFKSLIAKELKSGTKTSNRSGLSSMSNGDVATKAKAYYDKKNYTKAIEYYLHLIEKKYKPARSNYMIGEMKYYRKDYAEAIAYFKASASLYSKSSFMPTLMLHTAISMEKTGDKKNAKAFYNGIISKFPDTKYAKDAKKYLSLMKK